MMGDKRQALERQPVVSLMSPFIVYRKYVWFGLVWYGYHLTCVDKAAYKPIRQLHYVWNVSF